MRSKGAAKECPVSNKWGTRVTIRDLRIRTQLDPDGSASRSSGGRGMDACTTGSVVQLSATRRPLMSRPDYRLPGTPRAIAYSRCVHRARQNS